MATSQGANMVMYCPVGDGVFDDWEDHCPECSRLLQPEEFDPRQYGNSDAVVWLVTAPNDPEAQLWANTIRALDIPVYVRSGGPGVGAWASVSSFEHHLLVRERDLVQAHRVVREMLFSTAPIRSGLRVRRVAPTINRVVRQG
jgi:hypothetical protein